MIRLKLDAYPAICANLPRQRSGRVDSGGRTTEDVLTALDYGKIPRETIMYDARAGLGRNTGDLRSDAMFGPNANPESASPRHESPFTSAAAA